MNKLTLSEIISSTLLLGLGIFSLWRGAFWAIEQNSVLDDSEFYQALHHVMTIWAWGLLMITSCMYLIMTSASLFNAINWLSPMQFATLSAVCAVIAFFGGAEIYGRR